MKKTLLLFSSCIVIAFGCNKTSLPEETSEPSNPEVNVAAEGLRQCASPEVLDRQLREDPSLAARMNDIENFTARFQQDPSLNRLVNGVIEIPVVVNVLYRTSAQNISTAQINSQITILNNDFQALNADYNSTPSIFQPVRAGNVNVRFVLDQVVRRATSKSSWSTNDAMKKSASGIAPTSPTTKLNLWVCNMGGGILGYAQFPGGSSSTDGVVIDDNACGNTGTGIHDNDNVHWGKVYFNSTANSIVFEEFENNVSGIELYDFSGRLIFSQQNLNSIHLNNLTAASVYFVLIKSDIFLKTFKVFVRK